MENLYQEQEVNNNNAEVKLLYETRSQEAQDIIGKMPSWIIRSGIGIILLLLLIMLSVSAFVKYPDTVSLDVLITPVNLPTKISAPSNAKIHMIMMENMSFVKRNQVLLILCPEEEYYFVQKIKILSQKIDTAIYLKTSLSSSETDISPEIEEALPTYKSLITLLNNYSLQQPLDKDLSFQEQIRHRARKVSDEIEEWEEKNVVKSPIEGKVTFLKTLSAGGSVIQNEDIIAIIPIKTGSPIVSAFVPSLNNQDKIKPGDKVSIKLSGYPVDNYGTLKGKIKSISPIAFDGQHKIEIGLIDGMQTSLGIKIEIASQTVGIGEIEAINNQSLLQRILSRKNE